MAHLKFNLGMMLTLLCFVFALEGRAKTGTWRFPTSYLEHTDTFSHKSHETEHHSHLTSYGHETGSHTFKTGDHYAVEQRVEAPWTVKLDIPLRNSHYHHCLHPTVSVHAPLVTVHIYTQWLSYSKVPSHFPDIRKRAIPLTTLVDSAATTETSPETHPPHSVESSHHSI
jgi:hypothetical protein